MRIIAEYVAGTTRVAGGGGLYVRYLDYTALWPDIPEANTQALSPFPRVARWEERNEFQDHYNACIREMLRTGINDGALAGAPAFEVVDVIAETQVFHGSPVVPDDLREGVLLPHPPSWVAEGRTFADGDAAICFTPDRQLAVFFGLLGPAVPDLDDEFRAFGMAPRPYGHETDRRLWMMTSEAALNRCLGRQAVAYSVDLDQVPLHEFDHPMRPPERRLHKPLPYEFATRVTSADLSKRLLVVDADRPTMGKMWELIIHEGVHPLDLDGFPEVTTLEGEWDIHDHAYYRHADPGR